MYKITLSNGTTLENLELNGNNYIANSPIEDTFLNAGMGTVQFTNLDDGTTEIIEDCILLSNIVREGKSWLVFGVKSEDQKEKERLQAENGILRAQIQDLNLRILEYATRF